MQDKPYSNHLIYFKNIPYQMEVSQFREFANQYGQISIFQEFINKHGTCFVCYFDSRSASKVISDAISKSYIIKPEYAWNSIFPIEKLSSTLIVSYKNNSLIEIDVILKIFNQYGDISNVLLNDEKNIIKLVYFDTRSSFNAYNSHLENFIILLIQPFDYQNGINFLKTIIKYQNDITNYKSLYEKEKSTNSENSILNQELLSKIKALENEIISLKNAISENNIHLNEESKELSSFQHKCYNLKRTIKRNRKKRKRRSLINKHISYVKSDSPPPNFQDNEDIMNELNRLKEVQPHARKFSETLYEYSFSLYLYSAKCYKFMLQSFPFPAVSSIYYHYGDEMDKHKEYICDLKYSAFLIDSYIEVFHIPEDCPCIIGGDATVASGNPMFKRASEKGHVYLYQLQTLFPEIPVLPIYLKLNASSKFKHENLNDMFFIRDVINQLGLMCFSFSTDGDNGIDRYHEDVWEEFTIFLNEENQLIAKPKSGHPIIDLFHLLKTQRDRFFRQKLSLSPHSQVFDNLIIRQLVRRGKCFAGTNDVIRFDDDYALDFFAPMSFLDVISHDEIRVFSYYLLPFILWQCSIRCQNLSNGQRIYLLTLTFRIFKEEFDNFHGAEPELNFYENNVENCEILSCWTRIDLIKYMNTLIADIFAINEYSDRLIFLQRLSNYPVEKTFGNTRSYMNNSVDEILFRNILVHEVLRKEMNETLELSNSQKSPNEKGGVIISPETSETFVIESESIEEEIKLLRAAAFSSDDTIEETDLTALATLMLNFAEDPNMQDMVPDSESPTAMKQILMRWGIPITS